MGDISRHRDIYLNTRAAIPKSLLDRCKVPRGDLTYLELGNYLTDVSQFRDPVAYMFAKRKIWRENILPKAEFAKDLIHILAILVGGAGAISGAAGYKKLGVAGGALGVAGLLVSNEKLAAFKDADDWIDQMLGTPIEKIGAGRRRTDGEYGYLGKFFQHFIEGITHLLFAAEVTNTVPGTWRDIDRIPEASVSAVFREYFTQYYPHEHTDMPPYVWDASKRPSHPLYGVSRRQTTLTSPDRGIMNAVDKDYIQYLAEQLTKLEVEWRRLKPSEVQPRRMALVRMGKILHGVEDWYFHSNLVEVIRLREFSPAKQESEDDETFVRRFVVKALRNDPAFLAESSDKRTGMQRRLYRRLRFPEYLPGDKVETGGVASRETSHLRLDFVYPAFPSQLDTSNTLLGALEHLQGKIAGGNRSLPEEFPPWLQCIWDKFAATNEGKELVEEKAEARGVVLPKTADHIPAFAATATKTNGKAVIVDVLREWVPLVITLLDESERQRLVANVDAMLWAGPATSASAPRSKPNAEMDKQLGRHKKALQSKRHADGIAESNYERAIRMLGDCGFLAPQGQDALKRAFQVDVIAESFDQPTPGAGGFLIQFAIQLQEQRDASDAVSNRLNAQHLIFDARSDNSPKASPKGKPAAVGEMIGSHSLMSKDTPGSLPLFDEAKVLAGLASQSVFHLFLLEVSSPAIGTGIDWRKVLQHLIRYPAKTKGWESQALTFFRTNSRIPAFADVPELAQLRDSMRLPHSALAERRAGTKATDLELKYVKLEKDVAPYRYL